jgi:hypothetical protein
MEALDYERAEGEYNRATLSKCARKIWDASPAGSVLSLVCAGSRTEYKSSRDGLWRREVDALASDAVATWSDFVDDALKVMCRRGGVISCCTPGSGEGVVEVINFRHGFGHIIDPQLEPLVGQLAKTEDADCLRNLSRCCALLADRMTHAGDRRTVGHTMRVLLPKASVAAFCSKWCAAFADWLQRHHTEPALGTTPLYLSAPWHRSSDPYGMFTTAISRACTEVATAAVASAHAAVVQGRGKTGSTPTFASVWALPNCSASCQKGRHVWDAHFVDEDAHGQRQSQAAHQAKGERPSASMRAPHQKVASTLALFMCANLSNLATNVDGSTRIVPTLFDRLIDSILDSPARIEGGQFNALKLTLECMLKMMREWGRGGHDYDLLCRLYEITQRMLHSSRLCDHVIEVARNEGVPMSVL